MFSAPRDWRKRRRATRRVHYGLGRHLRFALSVLSTTLVLRPIAVAADNGWLPASPISAHSTNNSADGRAAVVAAVTVDASAHNETQSLIDALNAADASAFNDSSYHNDEEKGSVDSQLHLNHQPNTAATEGNQSAMVLGALFSLQNNILNATLDDQTHLLNLNYVAVAYPDTTADVTATVSNASDKMPALFEHVSTRNFAAYASTSAQAIEFSAIQNVTSPPHDGNQRSEFISVFEMVLGAVTYMVIIAMTVIGNILVVIAVFSYRPLKKVQNYFLVSLAASDLAVAVIVMPLHVVKFLADGRWLLGVTMCQVFTTFDILLCTSSIWNLCAIAIDRYFAIHDPIDYAQKRTPKFVCTVIAVVWLVSVMISVPPIIGWNDWSSQKLMDHCELTTEKAFVVYSASGSFFVPLCVMIVVYVKIFLSARQRIRTNRGRSALLKMGTQQNMSPGTSSECVAPRFARLTPLVAATTTSVAHLLQRSGRSRNKGSDSTPLPVKSKRSMSHASGTILMNGALQARRAQLANARSERSNSSGGALAAVPAPAVSRLIAMAQRYNASVNSSNNTLNSSANSVNNYCSIMQQTVLDNNANTNLDSKREKYGAERSKNVNSNRNSNLLFVITNDTPSTFTQNGGESMLSDELTTNTTTTTTSSSSTVSAGTVRVDNDPYRRPSTPIPSEARLPDAGAMLPSTAIPASATKTQKNGILKNSSNGGGGISPKDILDDQLTTNALKNRERISVAKEKRAAKTIAVIIFVFTFCWMPFFCVYVIMPFCSSCYIHPKVNQAVVWLGYINSSLNPFLYGILNLEFRRAFRKILCPKRFSESQKRRCALTVRRKVRANPS